MIPLTIEHTTTYRYSETVGFGPHRLMLRPRESRDLRLISHSVETRPASTLAWAQDVFGNALATATFRMRSDKLVVRSLVKLRLDTEAWPVFDIAASAADYPFPYSDDEMMDLGALRLQG